MIPRKLILQNFMCYRENVPPLEFDGMGIACLSGENGAGKSALLDALTWALWGEARLKSDDDLIALGANEMFVDLTFALDGQDYRVIRKRSKGKRGKSELDFQVRHNSGWRVLGSETLRETQQTIIDTLHMGYDTFANSAFLRQGRADEFTRKEPSKRKQVLTEILGLDAYEKLEGGAKERAKAFDGQLKVLDGQIAELERQAEQQHTYAGLVAAAEARVEQLGADVAAADAVYASANDTVQALERLRPQRAETHARAEKLRAERAEAARNVEERRRTLRDLEATIERAGDIRAQVAVLRATQAEIERLDGLRDQYEALVAEQRGFEEALRDAERQLRVDIRIAEGELKGLRDRAARRPATENSIAMFETQLASFSAATSELARARARRTELREQVQTVNKLQLQRKDLEGQINLRRDSLIGTREELKRRIKAASDRLKHVEMWRTDLRQISDERATLEGEVAQLAQLREAEHASVERSGALRAACEAVKAAGEDINKKLALLKGDAHACPLCGSELGHDGVGHIEAAYERDRQDLRAQYSNARREADNIEAGLQTQRNEINTLATRTARLPELVGRGARIEGDLQQAEDVRRQQTDDQRTLDEVQMQVMKGDYEHGVRGEMARVEASIAALGNPDGIEREMNRLETRIATLEEQHNAQADLRARVEALRRDIAVIDTEAPALEAQEQRLHDLRNTLDMGDFANDERVASMHARSEIDALGYAPDRHNAARAQARTLAGWADEERKLERAEARIELDTQALALETERVTRYDDDLRALSEQLLRLDADLRELGPATRRRDDAAQTLRDGRQRLAVSQRDLGEKRAFLQRAEDAAVELLACQEQRRTRVHRKTMFDELVTAFGKKGVQAMLIETAIPEIEREANALLSRMTDNQMHLSFETQGATKKGDVTETLDIRIADALGTRDYNAYSGGESFRVDFAIRIALAKLLAHRAGARLETLVIDEGFGSQDAKGRERLVEAITSVQPDFKQILVVTHIQELKDMFPVQIEVTKTQEGSRWAVA